MTCSDWYSIRILRQCNINSDCLFPSMSFSSHYMYSSITVHCHSSLVTLVRSIEYVMSRDPIPTSDSLEAHLPITPPSHHESANRCCPVQSPGSHRCTSWSSWQKTQVELVDQIVVETSDGPSYSCSSDCTHKAALALFSTQNCHGIFPWSFIAAWWILPSM